MHLHVSRVRRGGKTYQYAEVVQSFRRSDGMPTQRVLARLGQVTDLEVLNLRTALQASRRGERVNVATLPVVPKVQQSLAYLDIAVLLELWRNVGLASVLGDVLPVGQSEVAPADVVTALVLQRCVDPGSKLYAERWFPRTALPELQGIAPQQFHNTRVHRVLEQLDEATPLLMSALPSVAERAAPMGALFLDISDAHFVGEGPELADVAKTKEGLFKKKIGIVLLCNAQGYPLRWHVIAGRRPEPAAMHDLLGEVRGLPWLRTVPVVCDRAMGTSAEIAKMLARGLQFVTMLRVNEFGSYVHDIPHERLADLAPGEAGDDTEDDPCVDEAAERIAGAGMVRVSPTLFFRDFGVVQRDGLTAEEAAAAPVPVTDDALTPSRMIDIARQMKVLVDSGAAPSFNGAARRLGISVNAGKRFVQLLKLDPGVQALIAEGDLDMSLYRLRTLATLPADEQRTALDGMRGTGKRRRPRTAQGAAAVEPTTPVRVRAVLTFNPKRFAEERRAANKLLRDVERDLADLNDRLARSPRAAREVAAEIDRLLRRRSMLDCYRIHVDTLKDGDRSVPFVRMELNVDAWTRRRRYDGFSIVVAHPDVALGGRELCQLYRARDTVEADFKVIKSVVKLRPVRHYTDAKVRAHVTLCMLALFLHRSLQARLRDVSAGRALEILRSSRLNRIPLGDKNAAYTVTTPDDEQADILRRLGMKHLADDARVAEVVRPR